MHRFFSLLLKKILVLPVVFSLLDPVPGASPGVPLPARLYTNRLKNVHPYLKRRASAVPFVAPFFGWLHNKSHATLYSAYKSDT
jgi:hypothetical protein